MPGIMAHGATREEAAREIGAALDLALAVIAETGEAPPAPRNHALSALGRTGGSKRSPKKSTGWMNRPSRLRIKSRLKCP